MLTMLYRWFRGSPIYRNLHTPRPEDWKCCKETAKSPDSSSRPATRKNMEGHHFGKIHETSLSLSSCFSTHWIGFLGIIRCHLFFRGFSTCWNHGIWEMSHVEGFNQNSRNPGIHLSPIFHWPVPDLGLEKATLSSISSSSSNGNGWDIQTIVQTHPYSIVSIGYWSIPSLSMISITVHLIVHLIPTYPTYRMLKSMWKISGIRTNLQHRGALHILHAILLKVESRRTADGDVEVGDLGWRWWKSGTGCGNMRVA